MKLACPRQWLEPCDGRLVASGNQGHGKVSCSVAVKGRSGHRNYGCQLFDGVASRGSLITGKRCYHDGSFFSLGCL